MDLEDDLSITEISILPDGRICLFGASRQVLEMLNGIPLGDPTLKRRIACLCAADAQTAASESRGVSASQNDGTLKNQTRL